jgi:hypothetical protein
MSFSGLFYTAFLSVSLAFLAQAPEPKEMPDNKGSIEGENVYHNPTLNMTITLPGSWHFFDRTMYLTAEEKQKKKERYEKSLSTCQGPLCGHGEIDVALQSLTSPPGVYTVNISAYKLSSEYQNRERHPLRKFAEVMTLGSLGDNWVPEGDLTTIQLDGRSAYRLIIHHKRTTTAKGFDYVAESNGRVFMLLGTATSEPEKLQSAIENMKFTNASH